MLGFHTDGVHIVGSADTLKQLLTHKNIPLTKGVTSNTLVFAINQTEIIKKKRYAPSFLAGDAPWFVCTLGDYPRPTANTLAFTCENDLADFITALYYASQGFLHLDFELGDLKTILSKDAEGFITAYKEEEFKNIPKDSFVSCFCFSQGGFMESDRLFKKLTREGGVEMDRILLMGTFDSNFNYIRAFVV